MSCTVDRSHRWSVAQETLLVAVYQKCGVPIQGYVGCTECGLAKLRRTHPKLLAEVEAVAPRC